MTDQEQAAPYGGVFTVEPEVVYDEDDNRRPMATITHPKVNAKYQVRKDNTGYVFYKVYINSGNIPESLSGRYSTLALGVDAVVKHLKLAPPSRTQETKVKRELIDAAKSRPIGN